MFCEECGAEIEDTAKFCDKCGVPISKSTRDKIQKNKVNTKKDKTTNISSKGKWAILASIVIVALIIGVAIGIVIGYVIGRIKRQKRDE